MASLKKNLVYSISYQILTVIVPLITSPYLSRVLGAEKIGVYSFCYSIAYYFMIFCMLGISNYGNRTIAKVRDSQQSVSKVFCSIYCIQLILSIASIILYLIYCNFFVKSNITIMFIQGLFVLSYGLDITWYFYGKENFKLTVLRNSFVKLLSLLCIILFVKNTEDLWKYTLIMAGSSLIGQIVTWPYALKEIKISFPKYAQLKNHIKPIFILFVPVLAISVFSYMDKIMIGKYSSMIENGFYENSEKIISIPKALIAAVGSVLLPRSAYMVAHGESNKILNAIKKTMFLTFLFSFAMGFGLIGVSRNFSNVFWGNEFDRCYLVIVFLVPGLWFSVFGNVIRTQYLIPNEKDKEYTISLILGAVVNFIVNLVLIPSYGAIGAAIGTVAAEFALCFYQTFTVRKYLEIKKYLKNTIPFFVIGLIMAGFLIILQKVLPYSVLMLIVEILVGGLIYFILTVLYFNFSKDAFVKELFEELKLFIASKMYFFRR